MNNQIVSRERDIWNYLLSKLKPMRILELGSYKGETTTYLINLLPQIIVLTNLSPIEIHCVDTWGGSITHHDENIDMEMIWKEFQFYTSEAISKQEGKVRLFIHTGRTDKICCEILAKRWNEKFDLIYIDASHESPDVLCDAVLSFRLLRTGGVIIFDDYIWSEGYLPTVDILRSPKLAIDSFLNIYARKLKIIDTANIRQIYVQKTSD